MDRLLFFYAYGAVRAYNTAISVLFMWARRFIHGILGGPFSGDESVSMAWLDERRALAIIACSAKNARAYAALRQVIGGVRALAGAISNIFDLHREAENGHIQSAETGGAQRNRAEPLYLIQTGVTRVARR